MTTQSPTADAHVAAAETAVPDVPAAPEVRAEVTAETEPEVEELLIEEISIDGMCGVY